MRLVSSRGNGLEAVDLPPPVYIAVYVDGLRQAPLQIFVSLCGISILMCVGGGGDVVTGRRFTAPPLPRFLQKS